MARSLDSMKKEAIEIFSHALAAVVPGTAIERVVKILGMILRVENQEYDLGATDHIYVVGAGKAGASMAQAIEDLLAERLTDGAVTVKYGYGAKLERVTLTEAGHPVPDQNGVVGSEKIIEILGKATERDLVIGLISGGGSALMPSPVAGISLEDKQEMTRLLLRCGATINEINTMRKHLSRTKGGNLARLAYPARLVNLMLSDVVGDPADVIASGPCVPDPSTYRDCWAVIKKYNLRKELPPPIIDHICLGIEGGAPETPKPGDVVFEKVQNVIIASNIDAVRAAETKAKEMGYRTLILSTFIEGETREVARVHAAIAREIHRSGNPIVPPACLISGGETTVTVRGDGLGGRNTEFALAAALNIERLNHTVVLSGGTDGTDGPTDAAGAIGDSTTLERARQMGLDPRSALNENDSYHFFQKLGDLLITGPTNTNVMDVRIILVDAPN